MTALNSNPSPQFCQHGVPTTSGPCRECAGLPLVDPNANALTGAARTAVYHAWAAAPRLALSPDMEPHAAELDMAAAADDYAARTFTPVYYARTCLVCGEHFPGTVCRPNPDNDWKAEHEFRGGWLFRFLGDPEHAGFGPHATRHDAERDRQERAAMLVADMYDGWEADEQARYEDWAGVL